MVHAPPFGPLGSFKKKGPRLARGPNSFRKPADFKKQQIKFPTVKFSPRSERFRVAVEIKPIRTLACASN
jgi:hypothetical protein